MNDALKRGPVAPHKTMVETKDHKFEGYAPGRCQECGLRDTHPVHHKKELGKLGWPKVRKPELFKAAAKPEAPADKRDE